LGEKKKTASKGDTQRRGGRRIVSKRGRRTYRFNVRGKKKPGLCLEPRKNGRGKNYGNPHD